MNKGKQSEIHKTHIATPDFYLFYANKYFREVPEGRHRGVIHKDSRFYMDGALYSKLIDDFNKGVRDIMLYDSFDFKMPARMGTMCIRKRKLTPYIDKEGEYKNPLPIDWAATKELWDEDPESKEVKRLVRHRNEHSNGFIAEWTLLRNMATFTNKSAYDFKAARTAKHLLSNVMLNFDDHTIDYQLK